jgi:Protein of unknown function (DUF4232)
MRHVKSLVAAAAVVAGIVAGGAGSVASATTAPSCSPSQMSVRLGQSNGTAGTIYYAIVFTDTGGRCVIWGVPHIQPVTGAGHVAVGPAAGNASMGEMPVRHTLTKGKSVSVGYGVVESGNYTPSSCVAKNASGVVVSLTPFVKSTYLKLKISVCTKRVSTKSRLLSPGTLGY